MPKHLYLILISTFIFGMVSGSVLFLYNNTGGEGDGERVDEEKTSVTAYAYGGCERMGCASYRIEEDGAYTYIVHQNSGEELRYEDVLTSVQKKALFSKLKNTDLVQVQGSEFSGTCPAHFDGISYRYEVINGKDSYSFDSCREMTEDLPLFEVLRGYFEIFSLTHNS